MVKNGILRLCDGRCLWEDAKYAEETNQALRNLIARESSQCKDEAQAFFLGNNIMFVRRKADAVELVRLVKDLQEKGYNPIHIHRLDVVILPELSHSSDGADRNDFEAGDRKLPGVRAYRILKPLTELCRVGRLHITLMSSSSIRRGYAASTSIVMIAAVIGKMQDLVKVKEDWESFTVKIEVPNSRRSYWDVTWLWRPQASLAETCSKHSGSGRKLEAPERAIERFLLDNNWRDRPTLIGIDEQVFKRKRSILPVNYLKPVQDSLILSYKQHVHRLITVTDWEARAEAIANFRHRDTKCKQKCLR